MLHDVVYSPFPFFEYVYKSQYYNLDSVFFPCQRTEVSVPATGDV